MNIFIYGDSNTWGYVPSLSTYSKDAQTQRYKASQIWWSRLTKQHHVIINGLCGRAIQQDHNWLEGRNASKTIVQDIGEVAPYADLFIIQLGTNDCKSMYDLLAPQIASQLELLTETIEKYTDAKIMIIGPAIIKPGNLVADKYYVDGADKSRQLNAEYKKLAEKYGYLFVSGEGLEVGVDSEHLSVLGHRQLGERVANEIEKHMQTEK